VENRQQQNPNTASLYFGEKKVWREEGDGTHAQAGEGKVERKNNNGGEEERMILNGWLCN